jgi:hypothetical protein
MGPTPDVVLPLPRAEGDGGEPGPHEVLFEQAMARIATLTEAWNEIRDRLGAPAPAPAPAPESGTTELVLVPGTGPDDVLAARSEAPRWRRSLVS